MWLRDDSEWRTPNVRVLLYGYDTTLARSESFQSIDDIGTTLANRLSGIRNFYPVCMPPFRYFYLCHKSNQMQGKINYEPRPIVFIAHSLGGLVVKQVRGIGISNQHLHKIAITFDRSNADGKELLQAICKSMQPFQECIAQLGQALAWFSNSLP